MIVQSHLREYHITCVDDLFLLKKTFFEKKRRFLFLIDKNVWKLYQEKLENFCENSTIIFLVASEKTKSLEAIYPLYQKILETKLRRNDVIFSLGGGIIQDIAGYLAGTLYRGLYWIHVPTTLVAQVDSCIGGKVGLNFGGWKNQLGFFYPPHEIYIDLQFLNTLPYRDMVNGLAEAIKIHILESKNSFESLQSNFQRVLPPIFPQNQSLSDIILGTPYGCHPLKKLLEEIIKGSLVLKRRYVEADEFDVEVRQLLNYGHCFGHAIESASHFDISHGEAVLLGMLMANTISKQRGFLSTKTDEEIKAFIFPLVSQMVVWKLDMKQVIEAMLHDKKRENDHLSVILLHDFGDARKYNDVSLSEVKHTLCNPLVLG